MKKKIICTVTNDLSFDQRMNRICSSLVKGGYEVELVGRERKTSIPLDEKPFKRTRLKCFFDKGKLFYLEYNLRLFFYLRKQKADAISGIDLDSLAPTSIVAKRKKIPIVYDAHEYFTEMEEVVARPLVKKVWQWVEQKFVPKADAGYTVSNGYANLFKKKYGVDLVVVRNATVLSEKTLPTDKKEKYILYQGAVNYGRGLVELVTAMQQVDCKLIICGKGDLFDELVELTNTLNLTEKIEFAGYIKPEKLIDYTRNATIGLTIFSNAGLSNQYSLANRFFDYMHSEVPQLAMAYPEYIDFNEKWEIAKLIDKVDVDSIAHGLNNMLNDKAYYEKLKLNCKEARQKNNWQEEEKRLLKVYENLFKE